jgi:hypothetical protein
MCKKFVKKINACCWKTLPLGEASTYVVRRFYAISVSITPYKKGKVSKPGR